MPTDVVASLFRSFEQLDLELTGMTCAACANRIEKKLNRLDGVTASVNYATEKATVQFDTGHVSPDQLVEAVESIGYGAILLAQMHAVEACGCNLSSGAIVDQQRHTAIATEGLQLLGVTMNEPGVSRLVTVDVDEAVRMAAIRTSSRVRNTWLGRSRQAIS